MVRAVLDSMPDNISIKNLEDAIFSTTPPTAGSPAQRILRMSWLRVTEHRAQNRIGVGELNRGKRPKTSARTQSRWSALRR
jgi:hypothetical protein